MNVYLIRTPEYKLEYFQEVHEILSSFEGPMKMIADSYQFNPEQFPFLQKYWDDFRFPGYESDFSQIPFDRSREMPLSWEELFSLCDFYRITFNKDKKDFVILLTDRKNALNWFSAFDERRNIFIHTSDWEYYIKASQKFPVAYEVILNILQCLMKLDITEIPNQFIHDEPLGCMNDFCGNKKEIILKLRTGDICRECLLRMEHEDMDHRVIEQALSLFEEIRNQLLFKQGFTRNVKPMHVTIDGNGRIRIGNKTIQLNPIESTLFIFFITIREGVTLNDLPEYQDKLWSIYRTIRPSGVINTIIELIRPYHEGGTFSVNKSRLHRKLRDNLGEPMVNFYYIEGRPGEPFKINISEDLVTSDIRF